MNIVVNHQENLSYAHILNRLPFINEIIIENATEEDQYDLDLVVSSSPSFFQEFKIGIQVIHTGEAIQIKPDLSFDVPFLKGLLENEVSQLHIALLKNEENIKSFSKTISVLAFNHWPGISEIPEILAAYSLPNEPYVQYVIGKAKEYLKKLDPELSFLGYQSGSKNDVLKQIQAIFSCIRDEEIGYVSPPPSFEQRGQKIFLPSQIEKNKLGTCLDTTMLFSACLERVGLYPIVVVYEGHANIGVWLTEHFALESVNDDDTYVLKRIQKNIHEMILLETTLVTNKVKSFSDAIHSGSSKMPAFRLFIDIRRARLGGIKPINAKQIQDLETPALVSETDYQIEEMGISAYNEVEDGTFTIDETPSRINNWQKRLLDFSLRNPLLSYNVLRRGIPFVNDSPDLIEDLLFDNKKIHIAAMPQEFLRKNQVNDQKGMFDLFRSELKQSRLRAFIDEEDLSRRLVRLYRDSKTNIEETGANTLYIALGFLRWKEKPKAPSDRLAPILLIPIELKRISVAKGYYLNKRDEDLVVNISLIEYLKQNFDLDLTFLYNDLPEDDSGVDVRKILTKIQRKIANMNGWMVEDLAALGIFSFAKFVMWNDLVNNQNLLTENKVIQSLIEGHKIWETEEKREEISLDNDHKLDLLVPLSADSTQLSAIKTAGNAEESFVLHGPPGSGKSQTITNMIAQAISNHKTVLFVAAKMAALEVVKNRLDHIGLGNFTLEAYSNKAQKKHILEQIKPSMELNGVSSELNWQEMKGGVDEQKKKLNEIVQSLHKSTSLNQSIYELMNHFFKYDEVEFLRLENKEEFVKSDELAWKRMQNLFEKTILQMDQVQPVASNPWNVVGKSDYSISLKMEIEEKIRQNIKLLEEFEEKSTDIPAKFLDIGINNIHSIQLFLKLVIQIYSEKINIDLIADESFMNQLDRLTSNMETAKQLKVDYDEVLNHFEQSVFDLNGIQLKTELLDAQESFILFRSLKLNKVYKQLAIFQKSGGNEVMEATIHTLFGWQNIEKQFDNDTIFKTVFPNGIRMVDMDWQNRIDELNQFKETAKRINELATSQSIDREQLLKVLKNLKEEENKAFYVVIESLLEKYEYVENEIKEKLQIADKLVEENLEDNYDIQKDRLERLDHLRDTIGLNRLLEDDQYVINQEIYQKILSGNLSTESIIEKYKKTFYFARVENEIQKNEVLKNFSSTQVKREIEIYREMDSNQAELSKVEIYRKVIEKIPNISGVNIQSSEAGKLSKAVRSNGRGVAIRRLFNETSSILLKFKPVMLMSPLSVAQYLSGNFPKFDLVIFDEASQLPTSEAIGAMARGKEVVIVGDPNQLPPTSFFQTKESEEVDFESSDLESVLDDALAIRLPEKHLKWHYRSEHESLISFSNNHYYNNQLVTFPSLDARTSRVSLRVVKGFYQRGGSRTNPIEARTVVDEIFKRLRTAETTECYESIGVVTFSQSQQQEILDLIDHYLKDHPTLEKYFNEELKEPVFVKNLENVQGDERDIILFSVGYGPDENNKFTMSFGPLNRSGGWRRLNVAISRAKKEVVLFASFEPEAIDLSRTRAEGTKDLKNFMTFARNGSEPQILREEQKNIRHTELKNALTNKLKALGYKADSDVGTSQFTLPLAIRDPKNEENYMAYLSIDDEQYAANKTSRDREILKQSVLRRLGWKEIRIWSLDYWENPKKELERFEEELLRIKEEQPYVERATTIDIHQFMTELKKDEGDESKTAYQLAAIDPIDLTTESFYSLTSKRTIADQLEEIVKVSSPINIEVAGKLIIDSWGIKQQGSKIREIIKNASKQADVYMKRDLLGIFLWRSTEEFEHFETPFLIAEERRSVNNVSEKELTIIVKQLLNQIGSVEMEDLNREIQRYLGYSRISKPLTQTIDKVLKKMIRNKVIEKDETKVRLI